MKHHFLYAVSATLLSLIILSDYNLPVFIKLIFGIIIYNFFVIIAYLLVKNKISSVKNTFSYKFNFVKDNFSHNRKEMIKNFSFIPLSDETEYILDYSIVNEYLPANKQIENNTNPCFGILPEAPDTKIYYTTETNFWIAKNSIKGYKIILAPNIETALYKLNIWALSNKDKNWSVYRMTKFDDKNKIGIFEYNEFKNILI